MKKKNLLPIFLIAALAIVSYKNYEFRKELNNKKNLLSQKETVLKTIHNRKSVRHFTKKKVSQEDLRTLLKAGMAAPSGHNARPWDFIAITNQKTMKELRKGLKWAIGLEQSTAAIVVCGNLNKVDKRNPEFWITDTSAATQNILLAIEAMGLGGVWSTIYPGEKRMEYARKVLQLPEHIMPMCVIPIGYPTGLEKPKEKYDTKNIHWEKW